MAQGFLGTLLAAAIDILLEQKEPPDPAINPEGQAVVRDGRQVYFIDEGHVFRRELASGDTAYLEGSDGITAILLYKGILVALRRTGTLYALGPQGDWISIGNNLRRVLDTGEDLVALAKNGELWAYRGAPGPLAIEWEPDARIQTRKVVPHPLRVPKVSGRRVALSATEIKGVLEIDPAPRDVRVRFKDRFDLYSRLREGD